MKDFMLKYAIQREEAGNYYNTRSKLETFMKELIKQHIEDHKLRLIAKKTNSSY